MGREEFANGEIGPLASSWELAVARLDGCGGTLTMRDGSF